MIIFQQVDICLDLRCIDPNDPTQCISAKFSAAADGTKCAQGKWCIQGKCVDKSESYTVPDLHCNGK